MSNKSTATVATMGIDRRTVIAASMIAVRGRILREGEVVHLVAHQLTDLSAELATVGSRDAAFPLMHGRGDQVTMRSAGVIPVNVRPGTCTRTTSTSRTCNLIRSKLRAGIFGDNPTMAMVPQCSNANSFGWPLPRLVRAGTVPMDR